MTSWKEQLLKILDSKPSIFFFHHDESENDDMTRIGKLSRNNSVRVERSTDGYNVFYLNDHASLAQPSDTHWSHGTFNFKTSNNVLQEVADCIEKAFPCFS